MDDSTIQRALLRSGLKIIHPDIRQKLYEDVSFFSQWGISRSRLTTLGQGGPSFKRADLYDALRNPICQSGTSISISDQDGQIWQLACHLDGDTLACQLTFNEHIVAIKDISPLAGDSSVRTSWLKRIGREIDLHPELISKWVERLQASSLDDDMYDELISDITRAPIHFFNNFDLLLQRQRFDYDDLIPDDSQYFEKIAGHLGESNTAPEFIESGAIHLIHELNERRTILGLRCAFFACTSGLISKNIDLSMYEKEQVFETYEWLIEHGDPMSSIGAVEVGLRQLAIYPDLESYIERLAVRFISCNPSDTDGPFALFSAIASAVASQLWRRKILGSVPPFYRRHVALTHASLVCQAVLSNKDTNQKSIIKWITDSGFGQSYFLQAFVDLRIEPRWLPDFIGADQQLAEFIGRARNAATSVQETIRSDSLRNLLLGPDSIAFKAVPFLKPFLPGPLEASVEQAHPCPNEIATEIRTALMSKSLGSKSFAALINYSLIFSIPKDIADLAATALKRIRFSLDGADIDQVAFSLLTGLAVVAATSRSTELADSLRILTRVLRRRNRLRKDPVDELRFALMAAAAFEDLDAWALFAGDWLTEIAFEMDDPNTSGTFLLLLQRLLQIEPTLLLYCSKAITAAECFAT